ncbi:MAG TPA: chorismate synthase [bacterium]|nr:chorismate synthase [bacterium]
MEFFSAGESHGKVMTAILSGFPAGVKIDVALLKQDIERRKIGQGRSPRLEQEPDDVKIIAGISDMVTTGAPIGFLLENNKVFIDNRVDSNEFPRPGHVDFAGSMKFGHNDVKISAERSSARETVLRVAAGSVCKMFLRHFKMEIVSEIIEIGGISYRDFDPPMEKEKCMDSGSAGGIIKVILKSVPVGLGSNEQWFKRLDSKMASGMMSIPSVKGIYIGDTDIHRKRGVESLDLFMDSSGKRYTNKTGGIEGGISNGSPLEVTLFFKPVPSQPFPVDTVSLRNGSSGKTAVGKNDLWCIERAAVIAESMMCMVVTDCFLEKFGSDSLQDIDNSYRAFKERCKL